jgi:hypothetical protein
MQSLTRLSTTAWKIIIPTFEMAPGGANDEIEALYEAD